MFKKSTKSGRSAKDVTAQSARGGGRGRGMRFAAPPGRGKKKKKTGGRPE